LGHIIIGLDLDCLSEDLSGQCCAFGCHANLHTIAEFLSEELFSKLMNAITRIFGDTQILVGFAALIQSRSHHPLDVRFITHALGRFLQLDHVAVTGIVSTELSLAWFIGRRLSFVRFQLEFMLASHGLL
jgi:hypothetical protein